jgi:hypothetical protein
MLCRPEQYIVSRVTGNAFQEQEYRGFVVANEPFEGLLRLSFIGVKVAPTSWVSQLQRIVNDVPGNHGLFTMRFYRYAGMSRCVSPNDYKGEQIEAI